MTKKQARCQHIRSDKRVPGGVSLLKGYGYVWHWRCPYCKLWFRKLNGVWRADE